MKLTLEANLTAAERATLGLRTLYERFGYRKYQVGQFEEYGLYLRFHSFFTGGRVLSFTDLDGRLMALKPDVTLSIAKNARLEGGQEKAYYIENVYRESLSSGTIREIGQMGLESLGGPRTYQQAEVLYLAAQTLRSIGPAWVLEISHMGFVLGLFEALGLEDAARKQVMAALASRSAHGVQRAAEAAGVGAAGVQALCELCRLSGELPATLPKARSLCFNGRMTAALDELEEAAKAADLPSELRLDFALQGDMEYYDGLMMAGYLDGAPKAVLSGGRYDGLMKKLGRDVGAIGFALYLDELDRLPQPLAEPEADVLLLSDGATPQELMQAVRALTDGGNRVVVAGSANGPVRASRVCRLREGVLEEC